jgi:hypothetical protein
VAQKHPIGPPLASVRKTAHKPEFATKAGLLRLSLSELFETGGPLRTPGPGSNLAVCGVRRG